MTTRSVDAYLAEEVLAGTTTQAMADFALHAWKDIQAVAPNCKTPDVGVFPEGEILMTWNDAGRHLEVEINLIGEGDWFYCDPSEFDSDEVCQIGVDRLPFWVVEKLSVFQNHAAAL